MKKIILYAWALAVLVHTEATASNPTDAPGIGIDRIDPIPERYAYAVSYRLSYQVPKQGWSTTDAHHFGYGYYNKGLKQIDPGGSQTFVSFGGPGKNSFIPSSELMPRTITNDIRVAILDETLFNTHIAEDSFADAYKMALDNKQGELWKRQAISYARKYLAKQTRTGIFEDDLTAKQNALTLVESFKGTPHYEELAALKTTVEAAAEERKNIILSNPQVAVMGDYMKADLLKMLVSDDS